MTITTTRPVPATWNNTGGDVRIHLVPAGTVLLEEGEDPWSQPSQVTTPVCGRGVYHGGWRHVTEMGRQPLQTCEACFPLDEYDRVCWHCGETVYMIDGFWRHAGEEDFTHLVRPVIPDHAVPQEV